MKLECLAWRQVDRFGSAVSEKLRRKREVGV
jgi:hypothetical protein